MLDGESVKRAKHLYRAQNAIWLWLGLAAVLSLIGWTIDPAEEAQRSAIGRELRSGLDDLWHILLGVGGAVVYYGVWGMRIRAEIIGHLFVGVAVLINAAAVTLAVGPNPSGLILFGVAFASGFRVWFLVETAPKR